MDTQISANNGLQPTPLSRRGTIGKIDFLQEESSVPAGGGAADPSVGRGEHKSR